MIINQEEADKVKLSPEGLFYPLPLTPLYPLRGVSSVARKIRLMIFAERGLLTDFSAYCHLTRCRSLRLRLLYTTTISWKRSSVRISLICQIRRSYNSAAGQGMKLGAIS